MSSKAYKRGHYGNINEIRQTIYEQCPERGFFMRVGNATMTENIFQTMPKHIHGTVQIMNRVILILAYYSDNGVYETDQSERVLVQNGK